MTHALAGLLRKAGADHLVVGEERAVEKHELAAAQDLEQIFARLDQMLWDYMRKARLTIKEQLGLAVIRNRNKINRIISATCLYSEATIYDRFIQEFDDILTNVLFIMANDDGSTRLSSVSLDDGLIHPLFFIATNCRDGRIRHRALEQSKCDTEKRCNGLDRMLTILLFTFSEQTSERDRHVVRITDLFPVTNC